MRTAKLRFVAFAAAVALLAAVPVFSQGDLNQGQGKAVVTVMSTEKGAAPPSVSANQLALKINGKPTNITSWKRLHNDNAPIQLVVMIDDGASSSVATQLPEISQFIKALPSSAQVAVAYMENGRAQLAGPLSTDHDAVARELRLPSGMPGISGSPYFCLSDLAHHWPSHDSTARRVVVMVTNGIDYYEVRYNPNDPYLQAAIHDALRSKIAVYSIYWGSGNYLSGTEYGASDGQSLLAQLTQATGGYSYWQGMGNPVSFQPYLKDLDRRLDHQYEMGFTVPLPHGPGVHNLKLQAKIASAKVTAPQRVYVGHPVIARPVGGE